MGDREAATPVVVESMLKYHPSFSGGLTLRDGHRLVGSLTGVVASKSVTEASQGPLSANGNRAKSAVAEAGLTGRQTSRAGTKVGQSDPVVPHGRAIAQRIKGTPGITG